MNDWDGTPKGILGLFRSESKLNRAQPSSIGSSAKQESALWSEFESWGRQGSFGPLSDGGSWRGMTPRESGRVVKEQRSPASRPHGAGFNWYRAGSRNPGSTRDR